MFTNRDFEIIERVLVNEKERLQQLIRVFKIAEEDKQLVDYSVAELKEVISLLNKFTIQE